MNRKIIPLIAAAIFWAVSCEEVRKDYSVEKIPVDKVTLDVSSQEVLSGKEFTLKATVEPANAYIKDVWWASDNPDVATVLGGTVTGKAHGTANIYVITVDGGKIASCNITVPTVLIESVSTTKELTLIVGEPAHKLTFTTVPEHASDKRVVWKTNKPNVADVDENGVVTPKTSGRANITLTTVDGNHTAICRVTVLENVLRNPGFELPKRLKPPYNTSAQQWSQVPNQWFRDFYAGDPNIPAGVIMGTATEVVRTSIIAPISDTFFNATGSGAYFLNSFTGAWMAVIGNASNGATGGIFQEVNVGKGKYKVGATIGFRCNNSSSSIKNWETIKILSLDGKQVYATVPIKTGYITLFNNRSTCIVRVDDIIEIPGGINMVRFQVDHRTFNSPYEAPLLLFDDLLFARYPEE